VDFYLVWDSVPAASTEAADAVMNTDIVDADAAAKDARKDVKSAVNAVKKNVKKGVNTDVAAVIAAKKQKPV